jgi:hypothetical protein
MKILVFTEGTIFTHQNWLGLAREEIVRRIRAGERHSVDGSIPISYAARKLRIWERAGAQIVYLTSRREPDDIEKVRDVLQRYDFPAGEVLFRQAGEEYADVAERALPDIIVEDDCESIGGEVEMTYPRIRVDIKERIKSIVVREGGGIDHLPEDISDLAHYGTTKPGA